MRFFLACDEKHRRPTRLRPKAEDTTAKPRVLLLVNLSSLVGLGHGLCRFKLLYRNVLGTLFHFIGYYDVAKQTGYKFRPPKIPIEENDTPLRTHAQPRNEECWSP